MKPEDIDDRGLGPEDPADPADPRRPDAVVCPECQGTGASPAGDACPVCEGSGRANSRTGGG